MKYQNEFSNWQYCAVFFNYFLCTTYFIFTLKIFSKTLRDLANTNQNSFTGSDFIKL